MRDGVREQRKESGVRKKKEGVQAMKERQKLRERVSL